MFTTYFSRKRAEKEAIAQKELLRAKVFSILTGAGLYVCDIRDYYRACEYCRESTNRVSKPNEVVSPAGETFVRSTDVGYLCCRCGVVGKEHNQGIVNTSNGVLVLAFAEEHAVKPMTRDVYIAAYETLNQQIKYVSEKLRELPAPETPFRG